MIKWLHSIFICKYILTKKERCNWVVYSGGKILKEVQAYSPITMLVKYEGGENFYTRNIMQASKLNKIEALFIRWRLKRKASEAIVYEVLPTGAVVFITEITGLTKN